MKRGASGVIQQFPVLVTIMGWIVRCRECGTVWILEVSFDISDMDKIYHYCPRCKKNTFHDVIGRSDERAPNEGGEASSCG